MRQATGNASRGAERRDAANLHEVSPPITSQNRQGLTGHVQNCIMGHSADQLQPRVAVQDLAVGKQPCIFWPLHPCLYACQQTCTHHMIPHACKADREQQRCHICDTFAVLFSHVYHKSKAHKTSSSIQDRLSYLDPASLYKPAL